MFSFLSYLECSGCNRTLDADRLWSTCPCGAPLLPRYDLRRARRRMDPRELKGRRASLWRYHELLPVLREENVVTLGEGLTPLLPLCALQRRLGLARLWLKDESGNPGSTFKARGAAVGISRAKELGVKTVALGTNGNAGEAWATYAARAGMAAVIAMPKDAQFAPMRICAAAGAKTLLVRGTITEASQIVRRGADTLGWFNVSTFHEPYRIEGKKTMAFEVVEQLGWRVPSAIVFPTGGGISVVAFYKALLEMRELGWIGDALPKLLVVQAEGCQPIVEAFHQGLSESNACKTPSTQASGLRVPKSAGDVLVLRALRETGGNAVAVTDEEMREAIGDVAQLEGVMLCPEAAATLPGLRKFLDAGVVGESDEVVLLGTGSLSKYPHWVDSSPEVLSADWVPSAEGLA